MARYLDNPAGRLHSMLEELKGIQPANNTYTRQAWAQVFGVNENDLPELTRRLGLVMSMPKMIELRIKRLDNVNHDLLLRHMHQIEAALSHSLISFNAGVNNVHAQYNETSLFSLEMCSDALHRYHIEQLVTEDDLRIIEEKVDELIEVTIGSELDDDLKEFLLNHIAIVQRAIKDVQIRGAVALEEAVDRTWGTLARRQDLQKRINTQEPAWSMFASLLSVVASSVQVTALMLTPAPAGGESPRQSNPTPTVQLVTEAGASVIEDLTQSSR